MRYLGFSVAIILQVSRLVVAEGHSNHHGHAHLHHHFHRGGNNNPTPIEISVGATSARIEHSGTPVAVNDPAELVSQALGKLAVINKERYENIAYNRYEFADAHEIVGQKINAPPLKYGSNVTQSLPNISSHEKRDDHEGNSTRRLVYSISPELAQAARILAESQPPTPSTGEEADLAMNVRMKYFAASNDTNTPQQAHRHSDGLSEYAVTWADQMPLANRTTVENDGKLLKRASSSDYWMANLEQRGASPYAPTGYKVFRNVKDYGAKGE